MALAGGSTASVHVRFTAMPHMGCSVLPTPRRLTSTPSTQAMHDSWSREVRVKLPGWVAARQTTHGSLTASRQLHSSTASYGAGPACRMVTGGYGDMSGGWLCSSYVQVLPGTCYPRVLGPGYLDVRSLGDSSICGLRNAPNTNKNMSVLVI